MNVLFIEDKMENLHLRKNRKRAQVAQSWPKRGEKGYLKSEREKVMLQPRITKSATIAIGRSHFVLQNVQVKTSEHLDLLNS